MSITVIRYTNKPLDLMVHCRVESKDFRGIKKEVGKGSLLIIDL
jgi:hypothetical protein